MASQKQAFLIFPNTLFADTKAIKGIDRVFIVEEPLFFGGKKAVKGRQFSIGKMKLAYMRATMKTYERHLQTLGLKTTYVDYNDVKKYEWLANFVTVSTYEIIDFELIHKLQAFPLLSSLQMKETLLFPLSLTKICSYFQTHNRQKQPKRYSHSGFYKWAKQEMDILLHVKSYDSYNRQPLPRDHLLQHHTPSFSRHNDNGVVKEAKAYVESHPAFKGNLGDFRRLDMYPLNHTDAQRLFADFLRYRLDNFGPYQDAIDQNEPILYHSFCSTVLNNGLLASKSVVSQLRELSKNARHPIESLEAYVRQLCWRMWEVGIYLCFHDELRSSNHFSSSNKLNWNLWRGQKELGILPLDNEIKKALDFGYAAHIPRLMIFLNAFVMLQVRPDDVIQWFMEVVSMDATIYFMWPIVTTMGGYNLRFMQKPYISTSAYLLKMSNYPKGKWCDTFTALFYNFLAKNKSKLNGSCSIYLRNLAHFEHKTPAEQSHIIDMARAFQNKVTVK